MKKMFTAIRASDLETVKKIIEKKPDIVNCKAKQPPKKEMVNHLCKLLLKQGTKQ